MNSLTPEKQSWLAFTDSGKLALYGDPTLKKQLKLPAQYRVVKTNTGIYHMAYDPGKVQVKFQDHYQHDTSTVGVSY